MSDVVEIAVLGDLHGDFDAVLDAALLEPFAMRLCTGDLTPNRGRERFDVALRVAEDLASLRVRVVLGNHDGPTAFTGRSFPKSYLRLDEVFGDLHVAGRCVDFPDLDVSLVGARPLTSGGHDYRFPVPGREDWSLRQWGEAIHELLRSARCSRVVVLAHCGPSGLGATREAPFGCDFRLEEGDWGDPDLRLALDAARKDGVPVVAVVAGHMHHALRGGGVRIPCQREGDVLHVNAAVVPRVTPRGRALVVLRLEGGKASVRVEWHSPAGVIVEPWHDGAAAASASS
jgi:uncharacterized protein (TIGR04168 family)